MKSLLVTLGLVASMNAMAEGPQMTVSLREATPAGAGAEIGTVRLVQTSHGLVFYPDLKSLKPGLHGFHVHENGSCAASEKDGVKTPAGAAGGHYDPKKSGKHGEPWGNGHLGDLPALHVSENGMASTPVLAPRMKMSDVRGRALMVHAGGDNHSDHPQPLGGGGARVACGVIGR